MESIQAVREAIENLSTDEKIDEGQYLTLMNHLKSVYEKIERSERKEDAPVVRENRGVFVQRVIVDTPIRNYLFMLNEMFQNVRGDYFPVLPETRTGMVYLVERLVRSLTSEGNPFCEDTLEDVPTSMIRQILVRGSEIWRNLDAREHFLSHPKVRENGLDMILMRKKVVLRYIKDYHGTDTTRGELARTLKNLNLPFYTTKRVARNDTIEDMEEKTLQKLHPITIAFHIPRRPNIMIDAYTDKIQLGRSDIIGKLCRLMMGQILLSVWTDIPLERVIDVMGDGILRGNESKTLYPKMKVSGITASTREKRREYDCSGLITITYRAKYAGDAE